MDDGRAGIIELVEASVTLAADASDPTATIVLVLGVDESVDAAVDSEMDTAMVSAGRSGETVV